MSLQLQKSLRFPVDISVKGKIYNQPQNTLESFYSELGEELFQNLDGEFALIIEDRNENLVLAARDFLGREPLYYCMENGELKLSFSLSDLGKGRPVNFPFLGEYLIGHICSRDETVYKDVYRLPPGHYLKFKDGKLTLVPFYQIHQTDLKNCTRKDIIERIDHTLSAAIDKRLCPFESKYFMQLSGGIDSSTIFGLCKSLDYEPRPVNMSFNDPMASELDYVNAWGEKQIQFVQFNKVGLEWIQQSLLKYSDLPSYPNGVFTAEVRKAIGPGLLLTGYGGDELFSNFSRERLGQRLWNFGSDLTPKIIKDLARDFGLISRWIPKCFEKKFKSDTGIHQRLNNAFSAPENLSSQKAAMFNCLFNGNAQFMRELEYRDSAGDAVRLVSPFLDKQLVDLCFSIPDSFFASTLPKGMLRELPSAKLPDKIARRTDKADFTQVAREIVLSCLDKDYISNLDIYDLGWINRESVLQDYSTLNDKSSGWQTKTWSLWSLASANEFLKQTG